MFEDCKFKRKFGLIERCNALEDMYCVKDGRCSFYQPLPIEFEKVDAKISQYRDDSELVSMLLKFRKFMESEMK